MPIIGKILGDINISVYRTSDGKTFFYIKADNEDLLPLLDIIEDLLYHY